MKFNGEPGRQELKVSGIVLQALLPAVPTGDTVGMLNKENG